MILPAFTAAPEDCNRRSSYPRSVKRSSAATGGVPKISSVRESIWDIHAWRSSLAITLAAALVRMTTSSFFGRDCLPFLPLLSPSRISYGVGRSSIVPAIL